jgi:thiosulfate dehydrogenase (quinone) large subunit
MGALRPATMVVAAIAAILMVIAVNPWFTVDKSVADLVSYAFWISSIVMIVLIYLDAHGRSEADQIEIEGPAITRFLFSNSQAGWIWLPIRLFLGFSWLAAGWHKMTGTGWLDGGASLQGYWQRAVAVPDTGSPAITYDWWRNFLQFLLDNNAYSWFAYIITFGEILVGLGLIFGVLTGIAAFSGSFMNMSFMLSGSASSNPVLFFLAIGVILAWKVAGYYGVDRWLLPILGTPWRPGALAAQAPRASAGTS